MDIHFTITIAGLVGVISGLIYNAYRLGRILQRIDSHIKESADVHRTIDKRLTWVERNLWHRDR